MTHKQFETRKRITVYLSAEEYAAIETRANGSVSSYARKVLLANGKDEASPIPDVPQDAAIRAPERRKPMPATVAALRAEIPELTVASELDRLPILGESRSQAKRIGAQQGKKCAHGVGKGYHCWQCRGLAIIESAS